MRFVFTLFLFILSFLSFSNGHSHDAHHEGQTLTKIAFDFIENKGQWIADAKYKAEIPNGAMFLTDKGFVYHFVKEEDVLSINQKRHEEGSELYELSEKVIHYHAYQVNFLGANTNIKSLMSDKT